MGWNCRHTRSGLGGTDLIGSIEEEFTVRIIRIGFSSEYSDLNIASKVNRWESEFSSSVKIVTSILGHSQNLSGGTG